MASARSVLGEQAYRRLKEEIVKGRLAPGESLPEVAVAKRLGLSRTPLREALARLADDGLVDLCPNRPARVHPLVREEALDLIALRRTLSMRAHDLAARRITDDEIDELRAATQAMVRYIEAGGIEPAMPDEIVYRAARSPSLTEAIERLQPRMRRLVILAFAGRANPAVAEAMQRRFEAVAARDPDAAAAATRLGWDQFEQSVAGASADWGTHADGC